MAIVLFSSLVDDVRGKVGGTVFSASGAGPYVKTWARSTNARPPRNELVRANLGGLGAAWQNLTGAERTDWDTFAATDPEPTFNSLGVPLVLSGWNYFCRCNTRRLQLGGTVLTTAPTGAEAIQPVDLTVTSFIVSNGPIQRFQMVWDNTGAVATDIVMAFVTVIPSGAPVYDPDVIKYIMSAAATGTTLNDYAAFVARFGDVPDGWVASGRAYRQNQSGLRSNPQKLLATVV